MLSLTECFTLQSASQNVAGTSWIGRCVLITLGGSIVSNLVIPKSTICGNTIRHFRWQEISAQQLWTPIYWPDSLGFGEVISRKGIRSWVGARLHLSKSLWFKIMSTISWVHVVPVEKIITFSLLITHSKRGYKYTDKYTNSLKHCCVLSLTCFRVSGNEKVTWISFKFLDSFPVCDNWL